MHPRRTRTRSASGTPSTPPSDRPPTPATRRSDRASTSRSRSTSAGTSAWARTPSSPSRSTSAATSSSRTSRAISAPAPRRSTPPTSAATARSAPCGVVNPCKSEPVSGPNKTNIWVTGAPTNLNGIASDFVGITAPEDLLERGCVRSGLRCVHQHAAGRLVHVRLAGAQPSVQHVDHRQRPGQHRCLPGLRHRRRGHEPEPSHDLQPDPRRELLVLHVAGPALVECDDPSPHRRRHRLLRRQHHHDDVRQPADDVQRHGAGRCLHGHRLLPVGHLRQRRHLDQQREGLRRPQRQQLRLEHPARQRRLGSEQEDPHLRLERDYRHHGRPVADVLPGRPLCDQHRRHRSERA